MKIIFSSGVRHFAKSNHKWCVNIDYKNNAFQFKKNEHDEDVRL